MLQRMLTRGPIARIRRNHGLEHATIHLLSARYPHTTLIGRADSDGFYLYGEVPTHAVSEAAQNALSRLRAGEGHLALHPNCGTNLLAGGLLASLAAYFALLSSGRNENWTDRLAKLPFLIVVTTLALVVSQPLGMATQRHLTTDANPASLEIKEVRHLSPGGRAVHRVLTSS